MKIVVVYNPARQSGQENKDNLVVNDSIITAKAVAFTLESLGHKVTLFELNYSTLADLEKLHPDVFFNQAWGIGDDEDSEAQVAELLEKTGIPYTGSGSEAIKITGDKSLVKNLLQKMSIPTPRFQLVTRGKFTLRPDIRFPIIVKPNNEDCSLGIDAKSIFTSKNGLSEKISSLQKRFAEPVLIEEYIDGRELSVSVLGNGRSAKILPVSEIIFGPSFKNKYKIVDFAAKWETETSNWKETNGVCPAKLDAKTLARIKTVSRQSFAIAKCRDYGRVDIRLASDQTPYVLEVNVNPAIGPDDGLVRSAKAAGYTYAQFLDQIARLACSEAHTAVK